MKRVILLMAGIVFALISAFFLYYSIRLALVNIFSADAAAHQTSGMLIGAITFPVATIAFAAISWLCFKGRDRRQ